VFLTGFYSVLCIPCQGGVEIETATSATLTSANANTNTNIAGTETLPGTSLRASWAHGGSQFWHPSSPCVTWAIEITRIITVNSSTRLAPGSGTCWTLASARTHGGSPLQCHPGPAGHIRPQQCRHAGTTQVCRDV